MSCAGYQSCVVIYKRQQKRIEPVCSSGLFGEGKSEGRYVYPHLSSSKLLFKGRNIVYSKSIPLLISLLRDFRQRISIHYSPAVFIQTQGRIMHHASEQHGTDQTPTSPSSIIALRKHRRLITHRRVRRNGPDPMDRLASLRLRPPLVANRASRTIRSHLHHRDVRNIRRQTHIRGGNHRLDPVGMHHRSRRRISLRDIRKLSIGEESLGGIEEGGRVAV